MTSLSLLQNRMKRNPEAYKDDFERQLAHFQACLELAKKTENSAVNAKEAEKQLGKLATFLAAVASCFPGGKRVPEMIGGLLRESAGELSSELRMKLLQAIILTRVKGLWEAEKLIELSFLLFRVRDKPFRAALYSYIVKDVRMVNKAHTNVEMNKTLQNLVFRMLSDDERSAGTPAAAKRALSVVIELYKRRVWTDARAVNVVAEACFSHIPRNAVAAARFFLGIDEEIDELLAKEEDDDEDEDDEPTGPGGKKGGKQTSKSNKLRSSLKAPKIAKVTKKRMRLRRKTVAMLKRLEHQQSNTVLVLKTGEAKRMHAPRFPAIDLIHDPHNFAERLLRVVRNSTERFEVRLIQMNLISRVMGHHKLLLFPFYTFCQRYLQPHQENVTSVLACVIQASHDLVPPEEIEPLVKHLANNFVNDRTGPEVISVGLNSVRELVMRVPLITDGEGMRELIADLIAYRRHRRDRSIVISARSLLHELRRVNPKVLASRERGKVYHASNVKPLEYGKERVSEGVEGVELLERWLLQKEKSEAGGDQEQDQTWEADEGKEGDAEEDEEEDEGEGDDEEDDDDDDDDEKEDDAEEDEDEEDDEDDITEIESHNAAMIGGPTARLDATRMLTEEDFKRIRMLKKLEQEGKLNPKKNKAKEDASARPKKVTKIMGHIVVPIHEPSDDEDKDKMPTLSSSEEDDSEDEGKPAYDPSIVNPQSLDGIKKKKRRELAEKLAVMKAEQDAKKEVKSSRIINNTEKAKRTKDFHMVQRSRGVQQKQKMSLREQRAGVKLHMKALEKKSKLLTKVRRKG